MPARPFSHAALLAEFRRQRGSGVPEEEIEKWSVKKALIASIERRLEQERAAIRQRRRQPRPAIDLKRLQANDLD